METKNSLHGNIKYKSNMQITKYMLSKHYQKIHFQHRLFRTFYIGSKTDVESVDVECINVNIGFGEPMLTCI